MNIYIYLYVCPHLVINFYSLTEQSRPDMLRYKYVLSLVAVVVVVVIVDVVVNDGATVNEITCTN